MGKSEVTTFFDERNQEFTTTHSVSKYDLYGYLSSEQLLKDVAYMMARSIAEKDVEELSHHSIESIKKSFEPKKVEKR